MKTVLFIVNHSAQLKAPLKLILLLKENPNYKPLVYLNFSGGWNLWKEIEICRKNDIPFVCEGLNAENPYFVSAKTDSFGIKERVKKLLIQNFSVILGAKFLRKKVNELVLTLKENKVKILILPEDAHGIHPLFAKAASRNGIPTILIPFTKSNHLEILASFPIVKVKGLSWLYCLFRPKWKYNYKVGYYMPFSLSKIITHDIAGLSPIKPFVVTGGRSNLMLVENEDDVQYYQEAGIDSKKIVKTGAIYQDTFHDILSNFKKTQNDLYKKYNITNYKPVLLCTLFPIATKVTDSYGVLSYGTVDKAIDFWLRPLLECNKFQIWVHHHPRTNTNFVKYLEDWNLKVMAEPIESVLPYCDLVVSGISATTRMALSLGKPILCYTEEVLYTDIEKYRGTVTVNKGEEYLSLIEKLKSDFSFFEKLKEEAKVNMERFGPLDGKSYERILKVFDSIVV